MIAENKKEKTRLFHLVKRNDIEPWKKWLIRIAAVVIALLISGIVCAGITGGENFLTFFSELIKGNVGTMWRVQVMLQAWAILMCISLAVTPAFKMKFWNIGAEGQTLIASLAAVVCIMYLGGKVPEPALIIIMLAVSQHFCRRAVGVYSRIVQSYLGYKRNVIHTDDELCGYSVGTVFGK